LATRGVNVGGRLVIRRIGQSGSRSRAPRPASRSPSGPTDSLRRIYPRASAIDRIMTGVLRGCLLVTILPLFLILGFIIVRGIAGLSWSFFTELPAPPGTSGGGLAHALVGSARMVALAAVAAVP